MGIVRIIGILLIIGGTLGLVYGGFKYTGAGSLLLLARRRSARS